MDEKDGPAAEGGKRGLDSLLQDAVWYSSANVITKILSLSSFPLLARHFSTENFGVIELFGTIAPLIAFATSFGQDSAVARFFHEACHHKDRQQLISESFWYQLTLVIPITLILWFLAPFIFEIFKFTDNSVSILRIVILQGPFCLFYNYSLVILKWSSARRVYVGLVILSAGLYGILILLGTIFLNINVETLFWFNFTNQAVFGILGLFFIRKWIVLPTAIQHLPRLLAYAVPLGFAAIMANMLPVGEKWITARLLSVEEVGLYAAGGRIAVLVAFMAESFQSAWVPFAYRIYRQNNVQSIFSKTIIVFSSVILLLVFVLAALAVPLIEFLASERYIEGAVVVFPVALGLALLCIAKVIEVSLGIGMKPRLIMYGGLIRMLITFGLIFELAPIFGLQGVALGCLGGCAAQAAAVTLFVRRTTTETWNLTELSPIIVAASLGGVFFVTAQHYFGLKMGSYIAWVSVVMIGVAGWISYRKAVVNHKISLI